MISEIQRFAFQLEIKQVRVEYVGTYLYALTAAIDPLSWYLFSEQKHKNLFCDIIKDSYKKAIECYVKYCIFINH